MPRGISVHTYSGYVHVWSFTPYVWTLNYLFFVVARPSDARHMEHESNNETRE